MVLPVFFIASESTQLYANSFNYTNGNVLVCFRRAATGGSDLVVNAGPISYFTNLAPNTKVTLSSYTGQQLGAVGTNNIAWSAWAYFDSTATPASVQETIFMSEPRSDLNTQSTPYYSDRASAQTQVISKLSSIVAGAINNANFSTTNSSTAVLESDSYNLNNSALSYYVGLGSTLDFNQTFQAQPDQYTPANFVTSGTPVRADFYWLPPATGGPDGIFLGYFELNTNGVMTYTAYPSAVVTAPSITGYVHSGTTNTITFTTGNGGTYTLRGTDNTGLTTARLSWPAIGSLSGDGASHSLQDVTAAVNKFYVITAQ
jgi:hypothetical protein